MEETKRSIGKGGEELAAKWLQRKGYSIIKLNYTIRGAEIDIIAMDKKTIVFVEVKLRKSDITGMPCEAVTFDKKNRIRRCAKYYLTINGLYDSDCRFDVIEILGSKGNRSIRHIENAFS